MYVADGPLLSTVDEASCKTCKSASLPEIPCEVKWGYDVYLTIKVGLRVSTGGIGPIVPAKLNLAAFFSHCGVCCF